MNDCLARELASRHGCALHDGELSWLEMVEAAGEQRFERRRQRLRLPVLDRVREELLEEERVSPSRVDDLRAQVGVLVAAEQVAKLASIPDLADDLRQREVGRSLAVRSAAPDQHSGITVELGRQLARKPRLADPGLAQDQDEAAAALIHDSGEV